ncbi:MAG: AraC family transcriptional regulator [Gammaproteobacteria bacterium]|nr:AraC family transcriptional regulator [Gammaproteobacteria bacterium]
MKIYIKNMVCDRCSLVIENVLKELGLAYDSIQLGEVDFGELELDDEQIEQLSDRIELLGFEIIGDRKSRLIEQIKNAIISLVHSDEGDKRVKLSLYLPEQLHHDYSYLSHLFSSVEGVTIEQYYINQKIERAKELLVYDELSLSEIAWKLGYSSVSHLSGQFKKVTGLTPTHFRKLRDARQRRALDKI